MTHPIKLVDTAGSIVLPPADVPFISVSPSTRFFASIPAERAEATSTRAELHVEVGTLSAISSLSETGRRGASLSAGRIELEFVEAAKERS
jgi:hypothetical protein